MNMINNPQMLTPVPAAGSRVEQSSDGKREMLKRLLEERSGKIAPASQTSAKAQVTGLRAGHQTTAKAEIPEEFHRFDLLPGYVHLRKMETDAELMGIEYPFFKAHDGIARGTTMIGGREYINYSSYNYLNISGSPIAAEAVKDAIDRYGTSVSASRLLAGERPIQTELEQSIAGVLGTEDCIVFVGGHATNVTTIGHLFGPKDLLLHDELIHNSAMQGCLLSGSRRIPFPHNDFAALDQLLHEHRNDYERVLIIIEGIYSQDGDIPELPQFIEIKRRHKAFLMVDEAHSLGVLGKRGFGIAEHFGVAGSDVDIWMGTLSKTLASCGGYIAGCRELVKYLKYSSPGFIFSAGITPPNAASALAALSILKAEPERVETLRERSGLFFDLAKAAGLDIGLSQRTAVVPVIIGNSMRCVTLSNALFDRGIYVLPILYPAVKEDAARLRFFLTCDHSEDQIRYTIDSIREELDRLRLAA